MNEMVERVAKAIEKSYEGRHWDLEAMAVAAIEAMREPTKEMKAAIADEKESNNYYSASYLIECGYQKMIDAALLQT